MIVSNWTIVETHGEYKLLGNAIDRPSVEDGEEILTSAIHFTDGDALVTKSGSRYDLGKPAENADLSLLSTLRDQLMPVAEQTEPPHKAIIENWTGVRFNGRPTITGKIYSADGRAAQDIVTSEIVARDENMLVTKSGSRYALGTPHSSVQPYAKATMLEALPQVEKSNLTLDAQHS